MESMEGSSIHAKREIPQKFHKIIPRKNIADIMESAPQSQAICLIAPYGYGKTLSVVSWLRESGRKAAWFSLDKDDDSQASFLAGLTASILSICAENTHDFITNPMYLEDPLAFLRRAISRAEQDRQEKTLVIDNFHFIRDSDTLRFIRQFIYSLLGNWRVIIMSRAELPPVFNELILLGHIYLITPKELSFSAEEITSFFQANGCGATERNIFRIRGEIEGWPAALNVISTVCRSGPITYSKACRDYITIFFETEIWNGLNDDVKDFLLKTSILDTLTSSSCHAVTDIGATLPVLERLFSNGIFISKLETKDTYRYHSVFRDFLLGKLEDSELDEKSLYKKFAWWLYEQNETERSFHFFFKAGDLYGMDQVLKVLNFSNLGIDGFLEMAGCITELDVAELKHYPLIVTRIALIHYIKGNVEEMQRLYSIFSKWIDPGVLHVSPEDYAEYLWEVGWLSFLNPDESMIPENEKHLKWANDFGHSSPGLTELHLSRFVLFGFPSFLRGIRDYGNDGLFVTESMLERVESGEKQLIDNEASVRDTYMILAEYKYEIENFDGAEEIVRRIMTEAENLSHTYLYFICTALLVKLARAKYGSREIDALTARLEALIMKNGDYFLLPNFRAFELRNRLAAGKPGLTETFEKENRDYEDKPYFHLIYRHITFVRALLSMGEYGRAARILDNLYLSCRKYNRPTDLVEVNVLKSVALYGLGHEESACRHLTEALTASKKYGYIRMFSDDAKDIWPVLNTVRRQTTDKYIKSVFISCKKALAHTGSGLPEKNEAYVKLTKTEIKILKSLQAGMSYKEIALENDIRIPTVKSHAHSIYSKLDVSDKTSAVIAAQRMKILETPAQHG